MGVKIGPSPSGKSIDRGGLREGAEDFESKREAGKSSVEGLHDLSLSQTTFRVIRLRMRLVWHITGMGEERNSFGVLVGMHEIDHVED
jgi:hypothetical protein